MKELETEIEALKAKLAASKTVDSELNSGGQNQNNVDLDPASFPTQDIEVDLPKAVETGIILSIVHINYPLAPPGGELGSAHKKEL